MTRNIDSILDRVNILIEDIERMDNKMTEISFSMDVIKSSSSRLKDICTEIKKRNSL